jgi:hypothetical protein
MAPSGYGSSSEFKYAQALRWVKLSSFCTVLHNLCIVKFDNNYNLNETRTELIVDLSTLNPFSNYCRFPENDPYVCVDKPQLFAQVAEVIRVLATPDSLLTAAAIKDYFSAIVRMRELIHTQVDEDRIIFTRETFESEFHLYWF